MLVSFLPKRRTPIPHEPGEWIEFRTPAGPEEQEARDKEEAKGRRGVRDLGIEIVKGMQTDDADDLDGEKARRRSLRLKKLQQDFYYDKDNFDRPTLLNAGIKGWSYRDPDTSEAIPVNQSTIAQLDAATSDWAHGLIADLMRPSPEADKSPIDGRAPAPAEPEGVSTAV